jgi:DtxR family transcriptional regulator, Mn-dependent transcriptional regulator
MEDYLETIFILIRENTVARSKDIARRLKVNRSSVTGALQNLKKHGLVNYEPYGFVTLTRSGTEVASRVLRRHEALRDFMVKVLSIDEAEADKAACHMEHGISSKVVDRFVEFAEFVESCPRAGSKWVHGFGYQCGEAAIDGEKCERCMQKSLDDFKNRMRKGETNKMTVPLSKLKPGEVARIEKVGGEGAIKRRIREMGATKGSLVEVVRVAPLGDPIDVKIKGYHLSLRKAEAKDVEVERID